MAQPVGTISGLSSGIQWRDMVDQIMSIEQQRSYDPIAAKQAALKARANAWQQFQTVASKFRDAAATLQQSTAFDLFTASAAKSPTSARDLVGVSAGAGAVPGTYSVEVLASARAEKIGGAVVASSSTALGFTGAFALNGAAITVTADDSLVSLRNKINAVNTGVTPSGVSATILAAAGGSRLVLTAAATGATGIEATDAGTGMLQSLGLADSTTIANISSDGRAQTNRASNSSDALGNVLGVPLPTATSIKIGGQSVNVDFSVDSLESLAAAINSATGNVSAASVASETVNGRTYYRLQTNATVEVDASGSALDSARALAALGLTRSGRSDVAQTVMSANTFVDASTGLAATAATLATDLQVNGQSLGVVAGDTISLAGTRGDGSAVTRTVTITGTTTVQDVLDSLNDATAGYGAGTRAAVASLTGGRIALTDQVAGNSLLGLQITVNHAGGASVSAGAFGTANGGTVGLSRQIASGSDAMLRVDGQVVRSASNAITSAIAGVTLTALAAEVGTTVQVSVDHNQDAIAKSLQDFVTSYNAVRSFVTTYTADNAPLAHSGALRSMSATLTAHLLRPIDGLTGTMTTAALAGLEHDRNGVLSLKLDTFKAALNSNFDDVRSLFAQTGSTTDSELSFVSAGNLTTPSTTPYDVVIAQAATAASVSGASWTTYATAGAPDTMTISDTATGLSGAITLANGDSIALAVQKMNTMFSLRKMHLLAERTGDDRVRITSTDFGSAGGFGVAFTPGAGGDGTAMLGIAAQSYTGLDVAGTIGGKAATGRGQLLTGGTGTIVEGLIVQYTGSSARAAGSVSFSLGVGGALTRAATALSADGTGSAATQQTASDASASALDSRLSDIQMRLDARRAALTQQFIKMESALAKAQSISGALAAQLSALSSNGN